MARRESRETLGLSQAFELGKRSTEEYVLFSDSRLSSGRTDTTWTGERETAGWKRRSESLRSAWTFPSDDHRHNGSPPRNGRPKTIDLSSTLLYSDERFAFLALSWYQER